jgi:hypothetical protein
MRKNMYILVFTDFYIFNGFYISVYCNKIVNFSTRRMLKHPQTALELYSLRASNAFHTPVTHKAVNKPLIFRTVYSKKIL